MGDFELKILSINWLEGLDNPEDLCAHGEVFVKIGSEVIIDGSKGNGWTVSAAALHLMRTVQIDYNPGDFSGQLIPCCGFTMYAKDSRHVDLIGCPSGFDWFVKHSIGVVELRSIAGRSIMLPISEYSHIVKSFADQVTDFYKCSAPKLLPDDPMDKAGYEAFWSEWKDLRAFLDDRA
jgi:hypothetical protein